MAARQKRNNIFNVAEAAGTSVMTVTRAFKNAGRIAPSTRTRVLKVAKELGYENSELCNYITPPLASINIRNNQTPDLAAWMLMDRIKKPDWVFLERQ